MERRQEHGPLPVRNTIPQEGLPRKDAAVQHPPQRPAAAPVALSDARRRRALSRTLTQVSADVPVVPPDGRGRGGFRDGARGDHADESPALAQARLLRDVLDYRGREVMAVLASSSWRSDRPAPIPHDGSPAHGDRIVDALTSTTRTLLRWWFSDPIRNARPTNFHHGQRQAILRTVLACEWLGTDDPITLYRRACLTDAASMPTTGATPPASGAHDTNTPAADRPWACRLDFAAGTGGGRMLFALWLWQWLNHRADPTERRFCGQAVLQIGDATRVATWRDRWRGPVTAQGRRDADLTGWRRDLRLLLPPRLRGAVIALFRDGAMNSATDGADTPLRIEHAPDLGDDRVSLQLWGAATSRGIEHGHAAPRLRFDLSTGARADHDTGRSRDATRAPQAPSLLLAEYHPIDAIHDGIAKPVLLLTPAGASPGNPRHAQRRPSPRPTLRRHHHRQLAEALAEWRRRIVIDHAAIGDATSATTTPASTVRMLVLCANPRHPRAVLRALRVHGVARDAVSLPDEPVHAGTAILVRTASCRITPDPDIHVCVPLRCTEARASGFDDPVRLLAPALPAAWPVPEQAAARRRLRERIASGSLPGDRHALLGVVELPSDQKVYAAWLTAGAAIRAPTAVPMMSSTAPDASRRSLPAPGSRTGRVLDIPSGMSESIVQAWLDDGSGLIPAFVTYAADDPAVTSLRPVDPRRDASGLRDAVLARGCPLAAWPQAIVRTATHVHLVAFTGTDLWDEDTRDDGCDIPSYAKRLRDDPLVRMLGRVCRLASRHAPRQWRHVQMPIPRFWSWKRQGVPLSTLLLTLPDLAADPATHRMAAAHDIASNTASPASRTGPRPSPRPH